MSNPRKIKDDQPHGPPENQDPPDPPKEITIRHPIWPPEEDDHFPHGDGDPEMSDEGDWYDEHHKDDK